MTTALARPALHPAPRLSAGSLLAYGAFGMPLAMAALPLYVHLPSFYATRGVDLATLGALLLVLRLADGLVDPLLGIWSDTQRSRRRLIMMAAPVLAIGLVALFSPPVETRDALLAWLAMALVLVYVAFSLATINHGAWGAEVADTPVERTRVTAVRETFALAGVVVASIAPMLLAGRDGDDIGLSRFASGFAALTLASAALLLAVPLRDRPRATQFRFATAVRPLGDPPFRRLLAAFMANGIASAIPATLVLFYVADVLRASAAQGWFLALYFASGAVAMPAWVALAARVGKLWAWMIAMLVAVAAFAWAATLGAGDVVAFGVICAASGAALGADLALPPSVLADIVGRPGARSGAGAYFGLWTLATKLNLALAAGIALPLVSLAGYAPGTTDPAALRLLSIVYALVPCGLKLAAIVFVVVLARKDRP